MNTLLDNVLNAHNSIGDRPDSFFWKEIRIDDCDDGKFGHRPDCQAWVRQLASYILEKLGTSPDIRIHVYGSGGDTLLAVDAYSRQTSECIAITILLAERCAYLSGTAGHQFDIALPGIIDGLSLVGSLLSFTQGVLEPPQGLWVCLPDRQDASQHEPEF